MLELMWILYLVDVLSALDKISYKLLTGLISLAIFSPFIVLFLEDTFGVPSKTIYAYITKANIKRFILALGILFTTALVIPTERTMYIIAGLYTGDKMLDTVSQSETFQKAEQLLNQKLDEMLGDEK